MRYTPVGRLTVVLALAAALLIVSSAPVLAHAGIVERRPEDGAKLSRAPDQVRIRFNEPVEANFSPLEVYGPGGERVDRDNAGLDPGDPSVVVTDLRDLRDLSEGSYTVKWRVTASDGDPISGEYRFSVKAAADEPTSASGTGAEGTAGPGTPSTTPTEPSSDERRAATGGGFATVALYAGLGVVVLALLGFVVLRGR